jgi:hypothetical protein
MSANVILSFILAISILGGGIVALVTPDTDIPTAYKTSPFFGYEVTGVIFHMNDVQPEIVDTITFQIAPSYGSAKADQVKIQTKPEGPWATCTLAEEALSAQVATCTFSSLTIDDVVALEITAD